MRVQFVRFEYRMGTDHASFQRSARSKRPHRSLPRVSLLALNPGRAHALMRGRFAVIEAAASLRSVTLSQTATE